jgi:hypothetical protein
VTIPVIPDMRKVRKSRHYKPGEHLYYFEPGGFRWYVDQLGFNIIEETDAEVQVGRVDVRTFVLRRRVPK